MAQQPDEPAAGSGLMLEASRRDKLKKIQGMGLDPWGGRFDGHAPIGQIRAREKEITLVPAGDCEVGKPPEEHGPKVRAAGRILLQRRAGKLIFLTIWDWTGRIQILIGKSQVGPQNWA